MVTFKLLLDVRTRWSSTIFMIQGYLKMHTYVYKAVDQIYEDKFVFGALKPSLPLSSAYTEILRKWFQVIVDLEAAIDMLGAHISSTIHLRDVVLERLISGMVELQLSSKPGIILHVLVADLCREV